MNLHSQNILAILGICMMVAASAVALWRSWQRWQVARQTGTNPGLVWVSAPAPDQADTVGGTGQRNSDPREIDEVDSSLGADGGGPAPLPPTPGQPERGGKHHQAEGQVLTDPSRDSTRQDGTAIGSTGGTPPPDGTVGVDDGSGGSGSTGGDGIGEPRPVVGKGVVSSSPKLPIGPGDSEFRGYFIVIRGLRRKVG